MKTISSIFKLTIILSIFSLACKGPAGETGPAGATGATGAAGATGAKGDPGSVNITTTPWQTVKAAQWYTYADDSTYFDIDFTDKAITQAVLDKGMIVAYAKPTSSTSLILPLPYVSDFAQISFIPYIDPANGGVMNISYDFFGPGLSPGADWAFRWIIIPDITVRSGRLKNIDWKNYEEVKKELDLKD